MPSARTVMAGGVALFVILVVMVAFGGSILLCLFACPLNSDIGVKPNLPLTDGEKLVPFSRVEIAGTSYAIWDVRDSSTNILKFMVLVNPNDGSIVQDQQLQSEAYAIRLALLTADVVKSINDQIQNGQDAATQLADLQNVVVIAADYSGHPDVANALDQFGTDLQNNAQYTQALAATLELSSNTANALVANPSDTNADLFLTNLGTAAAVSSSQRATFSAFLFTGALQQANIPVGGWLEQAYEELTAGTNPSLSLLTATFGNYETAQTTSGLYSLGVY